MDLETILEDQTHMPEVTPVIGKGFCYEEMKGATAYIDSVLKSAFGTLKDIGFRYEGFRFLPLYESVNALSRTHRNNSKRSLEITHTSSFPISCRLSFTEPASQQKIVIDKITQITFLEPYNIFVNKDSKYIVSPKLGDPVFSLDRDSIFVSITRTRIVFTRTPYYFSMDGRVISTDIHRARLYYEAAGSRGQAKVNPNNVTTLVNYMLAEEGLSEMFRKHYGVRVAYGYDDDVTTEKFPEDKYVICRSHGPLKGRSTKKNNISLVFLKEEFTPELMHVVGAVFFILDSRVDCPGLTISTLEEKTGWRRALAKWAIDETDESAALTKIESHIESVKSYIDFTTRERFRREGYKIDDIYDLFKYVIGNFPVIAATHNVASMENKTLTIVPHFMFKLVSSLFRMMFELQKQAAKKPLSAPQVRKLINALWKEEAALNRITQETNVRNLDHTTDVALLKATRLMVPQSNRGSGSKKMAEMSDPAFEFHWSKLGITTYQFTNKSCPTALDSLNCFAQINRDGVVTPHPNAMPVINNIRDLTEK